MNIIHILMHFFGDKCVDFFVYNYFLSKNIESAPFIVFTPFVHITCIFLNQLYTL